MRSMLFAIAVATAITACASSAPVPGKDAAAPAAAKPLPQCYSGDHGKFFDVGAKATVSGVDVVCEKTSDGKAAQWMGMKAKH